MNRQKHAPEVPTKLYKYRSFGIRSLRVLIDNEIHYSDFATFNDPLDCKPIVDVADVDLCSLERLYYRFVKRIGKRSSNYAKSEIRGLRYSATDPEYTENSSVENENKSLLAQAITELLYKEMRAKRIFCLSAVWNSPLMWSHYADQHRGICIEYDTTRVENLRAVDYEGEANCNVNALDLIRREFDGCIDAEKRIYNACFLSKAQSWYYEQEWRDIQPIGDNKCGRLHDYEITAVYLGLNCDRAVETAIVKLLNANPEVEVYRIFRENSFCLSRGGVGRDEIEQWKLRTYRPTSVHDDMPVPESFD